MKINKIKVNSYGKLKEKEIDLKEGINLIYGKNESGKSTLLKFIVNSFYGISKNKKGKEYSDIEKYTPWVGEEFSGKIEYELDNQETYEVYRDFKKKNPKIFNEKGEEISKEFTIDKTKGNEFFYNQTKVDEELFLSTVVVGQQEVKLGKQEQNMLVQKIANLVGTGEDNVSFKRAMDRINRRQLEEIGSERSREKPVNIIGRKIEELKKEKETLEKYEDFRYEIEENKNSFKKEISSLENEEKFLRELKRISEKENLEKETIKIQKNIKKENEEKINEIKKKKEEIKNQNKNILEINFGKTKNYKKINEKKNKLNKKIILFFILLIAINILQFIFIKNTYFNYIFLLTVPMFLIVSINLKKRLNNKIKIEEEKENEQKIQYEKINSQINYLNQEENLLEKNNQEIDEKIKYLENNLNLKFHLEKEKIKNNYLNKIEENKINEFLLLENSNDEIENLQNKINDKKIELHQLELNQKNIEPKLNNLAKIEEELVNHKEKMSTLENLNKSFLLAKEVLEEAYEKMKNTVTPKFTQELSKNISEITKGKYNHLMFHDQDGLIVELKNGNYVPASKLSIGTIDQLYLSLRLSMVENLSEETMPIILDEAFAYYDGERLENILQYIKEKFKNHQVIIFTCTHREEEIFEKIKIPYHKVTL